MKEKCRPLFRKESSFDASRSLASKTMESLDLCQRSEDSETNDLRRIPSSNFSSMKRSRCQIGTFDMSGLKEVSKQVESSIAFPVIEWPSYEGDDDTDSDEDVFKPQVKRPRLGLVRSAPSFNLVALASLDDSNDTLYG